MNRLQKLIVGVTLVSMGIATFALIPFVYQEKEYVGLEPKIFIDGEELSDTDKFIKKWMPEKQVLIPKYRLLDREEINPFPAYGCIFIGLLLAGSGLLFMCSTKK